MERRPRFLTDVDEVLADFQTPVLAALSHLVGKTIRPEDFETWDILKEQPQEIREQLWPLIESPGFCASMRVRDDAPDFINEIRKYCDVYAVTSPWHSQHWMWERTQWLIKHFGFTKNQIVHCSAKYMCRAEFFLDDNPEHVEKWAVENPEGTAMLYHIPNTRNHVLPPRVHRVRTWDTVLSHIKNVTR